MNKAAMRKNIISDLSNIESQIQEIEFKIECYDSTYSDADEFPCTKENLQDSLSSLKEYRKELNKQLKEIERL